MLFASTILTLAAGVITTASELATTMRGNVTNAAFEITATVNCDVWGHYSYISVSDASGSVMLMKSARFTPDTLRAGNVIRARGTTAPGRKRFAVAVLLGAEVVSRGSALAPAYVSIPEFNRGACDARYIRLRGTVKDAFRDEIDPNWIYLVLFENHDIAYAAFKPAKDDRRDFRHLIGCDIVFTGLCNPDEGGARHHTGRVLIGEDDGAVEIIRTPPWWTPAKFLTVIGILLAALAAAICWIFTLRVVAERRSRELLREKVAHVSSELRIDERTRLAAELHDSVAQNLTGVSFQINAAVRLADSDKNAMLNYLDLASRSLKSCREELRNCLWDLRNQALDEPDMNAAIRQTLVPHLGDAELQVRFNVPRTRLSDNTAHAVLRIVRELVSNSLLHGHATQIKVAGGLDGGRLMFSVRDNGCGFDPDAVPGSAQGHFGLQGIRERIRRFGGEMRIESVPGKGTKTVIALT